MHLPKYLFFIIIPTTMKFVKQFLIIVTVSLLGELLAWLIPLPIPGGIYGLILMFCALKFKIFPLSKVKETSKFFIDIMPIFFVPPGVAILDSLDILKAHWWQIALTAILSTFVVMIISGKITTLILTLRSLSLSKGHAKEDK